MKKIITLIILIIFLVCSGCATTSGKIPIKMSDGTTEIAEFNYTRWFNQKVEGFYLEKTEDEWILSFEKQEATNTTSFQVGPYNITIGDLPE